jgi:Ni/Co efflux regulator RcnB
MKKLILGLVAASMVAAPAAAAPYAGSHERGRYEQSDRSRDIRSDRGYAKKLRAYSWRKGERFDRRRAHTYRSINNPRAYGLRAAPRGYRWVRSDNDALLVGITSGIISAVIAGRF